MSGFTVNIRARAKAVGKRPKTVGVKTVLTSTGEKARLLTVDANSASFGEDFLYVFKQNVRRARKENKERFGSPLGVTHRD